MDPHSAFSAEPRKEPETPPASADLYLSLALQSAETMRLRHLRPRKIPGTRLIPTTTQITPREVKVVSQA